MRLPLILTLLTLTILVAYIIQQVLRTQGLIQIGVALSEKTVPYSREVVDAKLKILFVGDSTGVGVGAGKPEESIAGMVGAMYPNATIVNKAVSGAKVADVIHQIKDIPDASYALVMVHIGGNDVVRFTKDEDVQRDIAVVLEQAQRKGSFVLLTSTGDVGTAPLLPAATRWLFERKTRSVRAILLAQVAATNSVNVRFADLFREHSQDPFFLNPEIYYAADSFHPSTKGYQDWFQFISKELDAFPLEK